MNFLVNKRQNQSKPQPKPNKNQTNPTENTKKTKEIDSLSSTKFRMLNEMLYTSNSKEALDYFNDNKDDFIIYHKGFSSQSSKWPKNPNVIIIKELLKKKYKHKAIIDLGCGEAKISEALLKNNPNTNIKSYDLIAINDRVTVCDIKNLPLSTSSIDVCVFCLSLMGTNYIEFIIEANRVLKTNGSLFIAEIESRIRGDRTLFEKAIESIGFSIRKVKDVDGYFNMYVFRKVSDFVSKKKDGVVRKYSNVLSPCLYKKR